MKDLGNSLSKVPEVTLTFWLIKILATTLGETGGDAVSMSLNLGYLVSSVIFGVLFLGMVIFQVKAHSFKPFVYWATIITTTTLGTTLADFFDRSLGLGYSTSSLVLLILLLGSLCIWRITLGSVSYQISNFKSETFYWVTIMLSQTLGTALGDWTADTQGLGYLGATGIYGALLAFVALGYYFTKFPRPLLFWAAFVLTRPLGAVVGDFLDKPITSGGLDLSRFSASLVLLFVIMVMVYLIPQRPASKNH